MAEPVVGLTLARVGKHLVGLFDLLELFLRILAVRVAVGVKLHGELAVRLLDLVVRGVFRQAEHFVVVTLRHQVVLSFHAERPGWEPGPCLNCLLSPISTPVRRRV